MASASLLQDGSNDAEHALCVGDQPFERVRGEPRVEQERNGAGAHRAEEEFDELDPVADQHGDALAGLHAEAGEHRRHAVHPLVELPVGGGALPAAEQVDDRDFVGQTPHGRVEEVAEIAAAIGDPCPASWPDCYRTRRRTLPLALLADAHALEPRQHLVAEVRQLLEVVDEREADAAQAGPAQVRKLSARSGPDRRPSAGRPCRGRNGGAGAGTPPRRRSRPRCSSCRGCRRPPTSRHSRSWRSGNTPRPPSAVGRQVTTPTA